MIYLYLYSHRACYSNILNIEYIEYIIFSWVDKKCIECYMKVSRILGDLDRFSRFVWFVKIWRMLYIQFWRIRRKNIKNVKILKGFYISRKFLFEKASHEQHSRLPEILLLIYLVCRDCTSISNTKNLETFGFVQGKKQGLLLGCKNASDIRN